MWHTLYRNALFCATGVTMSVYIVWRIIFTIPTQYGVLSLIAGILLIAAETIAAIEALVLYTQLKKRKIFELPEIPENWYPDVDILIATHNEPINVLYKTVNACVYLDYPDKTKVHVYLCDDGNRPEMERLSREFGIGYFGLGDNRHAKAGNLNNALAKTSSPLVAIVDSDMILRRNFLRRMVPYFFLPRMKKKKNGHWVPREDSEIDPNEKIGFVQAPQSFYNPDLFQYNLFSEKKIPNEQDYFFREINVGKNSSNSTIFAGSNTILSRKALEEVGYISINTITEDFETGLRIQKLGYKTFATDEILAQGLAPTSIKSLIAQRERWGRGCIQSLYNVGFFTDLKIPMSMRISYMCTFFYWWTFFRRFVYIISPILFALFDLRLIDASFQQILVLWLPSYLLYNRSLREFSGNIRNQHWSNVIDTILFPYLMWPLLKETFGFRQKKFLITQKNRAAEGKHSTFFFALPHLILLAASFLALLTALRESIGSGMLVYHTIVIFWLVLNSKDLIFAVFFMSGRKSFRNDERFYVTLPIRMEYSGKNLRGFTSDISENGLSIILSRPEYLPYDEAFSIRVEHGIYKSEMKGIVVHVAEYGGNWKYSVRIQEIDERNRREYSQIVYDRKHTLPKQLDLSWSIFEDFNLNMNERAKSVQSSLRKLPRVKANLRFKTDGGIIGTLRDFNYRYAFIEFDSPETPAAENFSIEAEKKITLRLERLKQEGLTGNGCLYAVTNWKELAANETFVDILATWSSTTTGEGRRNDAALAV